MLQEVSNGMKVGYIFAYFGDGGAEEHAFLLAQKAKQAGHEPLFIISKISNSALSKLKNEKFEIIYLPMENSFDPIRAWRSTVGLRRIIILNKIDIIHSHMLREQSLAIMAKLLGCRFKLIRTFHRFDQYNWKMQPLMPLYRKYTDAFISISKEMGKYMASHGIIDKVHLIKNGVPKIEVSQHESAIGYIGRLALEKGILKFIQSNLDFFRINNLVVAGDGPDFDEIKKLINEHKLSIILLGKISDKSSFYERISVLVLPSETEVLPLVVLEAYSCGLPVVAFDIAPLRDLIKTKNGVLVKFPDYVQIGKVAKKLLATSDKYSKFNIDTYNTKYSVDIMWSKTYALYQSLLSSII